MSSKTDSPLQMFLASAFVVAPEKSTLKEEVRLETRLSEIDTEIEQVSRVNRDEFLPFEAAGVLKAADQKKTSLMQEKEEIKKTLGKLSSEAVSNKTLRDMHIEVAKKGYPEQLDLTPLTSSNKSGPNFMVSTFDNTSGKCEITIRMDKDQSIFRAFFRPKLPSAIEALLQTACNDLAYNSRFSYTKMVISAAFGGYAGGSTKDVLEAVKQARSQNIFDQILVIAEAPEWKVNSVVEIQVKTKVDPLVVGWVEKTKQMFFITAYDMTPIEEYFLNQAAFGVTFTEK